MPERVCLLLFFKDVYDSEFMRNVYQSAVVSYQELKEDKIAYDGSVRIIYHTRDAYKRTAKILGLMDDFKVSSHCVSLFLKVHDCFLWHIPGV